MTVSLEFLADLDDGVEPLHGIDTLGSLAGHALRAEGASGAWEISVLLTGDAGIQQMHLDYMGLDSPTDIMTFPYDAEDVPGVETMTQGGDIVISIETAAANAVDAGWSVLREVQFLVLHGVLHLLGWDDETPELRSAMLGRQRAILDEWLAPRG